MYNIMKSEINNNIKRTVVTAILYIFDVAVTLIGVLNVITHCSGFHFKQLIK